jgi:hypothetical protein
MVGLGFTDTEITAVFVHGPFEPVTVYDVFDVGETDTALPVNEPGIHV